MLRRTIIFAVEYISQKYTMITYLRDSLNGHNFIYAFSPDCKFTTEQEFLERYPGDEYVDMLGLDNYWDFRPDGANDPSLAQKKLIIISELAKKRINWRHLLKPVWNQSAIRNGTRLNY